MLISVGGLINALRLECNSNSRFATEPTVNALTTFCYNSYRCFVMTFNWSAMVRPALNIRRNTAIVLSSLSFENHWKWYERVEKFRNFFMHFLIRLTDCALWALWRQNITDQWNAFLHRLVKIDKVFLTCAEYTWVSPIMRLGWRIRDYIKLVHVGNYILYKMPTAQLK